jgi:hypothetical protein
MMKPWVTCLNGLNINGLLFLCIVPEEGDWAFLAESDPSLLEKLLRWVPAGLLRMGAG